MSSIKKYPKQQAQGNQPYTFEIKETERGIPFLVILQHQKPNDANPAQQIVLLEKNIKDFILALHDVQNKIIALKSSEPHHIKVVPKAKK